MFSRLMKAAAIGILSLTSGTARPKPGVTVRCPSVTEVARFPMIAAETPQPPLNPADYQQYIGAGTGRITAHFYADLKDGTRTYSGGRLKAYAYPDTPYTFWLLEQFMHLANAKFGFTLTVPGVQGVPTPVPHYLLPIDYKNVEENPTLRAARTADSCDRRGTCEFSHLRPGKYLLFAVVYQEMAVTHQNQNSTYSYDPNNDRYDQHTQVTSHVEVDPVGGLMLMLNGHLILREGGHVSAGPPPANFDFKVGGFIQPGAFFHLQ